MELEDVSSLMSLAELKSLIELQVCVAVCCSVLQRVAACCSVLQRVKV